MRATTVLILALAALVAALPASAEAPRASSSAITPRWVAGQAVSDLSDWLGGKGRVGRCTGDEPRLCRIVVHGSFDTCRATVVIRDDGGDFVASMRHVRCHRR